MEIVFNNVGNDDLQNRIKLIDKYYCNFIALIDFRLTLYYQLSIINYQLSIINYQLSTKLWKTKTLMSS